MLGTVVPAEPSEWEPGPCCGAALRLCRAGGQGHPAAWDGPRSLECVSVGSCDPRVASVAVVISSFHFSFYVFICPPAVLTALLRMRLFWVFLPLQRTVPGTDTAGVVDRSVVQMVSARHTHG